ncbi:heme NO-binding domain-containing protein [Leptobacterium sp. I13]|uniref:heme NO-binding domain-containing protein n=1 Tax=Leptobacterium meishanense TaxID=3128904 RepID=UPI0030EF8993
MKGIVFTEFLEMVETTFGLETVDHIIEKSNLKSEGIYTSVGTYDFAEMLSLLSNLSEKVNIPIGDLLYAYGKYFFNVLTASHPNIFKQYKTPIALLSSIENHIHVHVRKIYPGAELPVFDVIDETDKAITMVYSSKRGMYRFAQALMEKTFEHYKIDASIHMEKLKEDGTKVKFMATYNE